MLGAAVTRRAAHWSFDASGLYTIAGENDDHDDLGDRFAYGLSASYRVLGHPPHHQHAGIGAGYHGPCVDLALELGRTAGYLTLGAPIVTDMRGVQAEPEFRLTAGLSRRF
jgi:hypothetical protein